MAYVFVQELILKHHRYNKSNSTVSLYYDMLVFHLMLMVPPSVVSGPYAEGCLNHWQLFGFVIVVI